MGWGTALFWPEGDDTGSVGRPLPGYSVQVVDDNGDIVYEDQKKGELFVKTSSMMLGYLDNPEATARTIDPEGWLKAGDIGYRKDGKYYVVGWKKDMIKVRGWRVAPAEVEAILLEHSEIQVVVVLGVPDADGTGEVARAYIVREPPRNETVISDDVLAEDIKNVVAAKLARFKHPDGGIFFVCQVPRNAMGEILKAKLLASHED